MGYIWNDCAASITKFNFVIIQPYTKSNLSHNVCFNCVYAPYIKYQAYVLNGLDLTQ